MEDVEWLDDDDFEDRYIAFHLSDAILHSFINQATHV